MSGREPQRPGDRVQAQPPALLVRSAALTRDPALQAGGRGARKLLVTELYPDKEHAAADPVWQPPTQGESCPVLATEDTELAVFNQDTPQDRHCHRRGTEIYWVIEGEMRIEVEGHEYQLVPGDLIVVNPGAVHEVLRAGHFLSGVLTANCGGVADKFNVPRDD